MKLNFKNDPELSFVRAVVVVATGGRVVDDRVEAAVREPINVVNERLDLAELDVARFWEEFGNRIAGSESDRVEASLLSAGCSELGVDSLVPVVLGRLADARLAYRETFPKLAEQLPLRARPLKELWEASGPGTLREIGRRTVAKLIPAKLTLHLVQPVRGGDGGLLNVADGIWMEAVLSNPDPRVHETLRLAWLIARKGIDRGEENRLIEPRHWRSASAMALIPYVLGSAEELGLSTADDKTITTAARLWLDLDDVSVLLRWWSQMRERELPLPVAIKALDKMMHD